MYLSRLYQVTRIMNPDPRLLNICAYNSKSNSCADSKFLAALAFIISIARVWNSSHIADNFASSTWDVRQCFLVIPTPQWAGKLRETWVGGKGRGMGKRRRKKKVAPFLWLYFPLFCSTFLTIQNRRKTSISAQGCTYFRQGKEEKDFCRNCVFLLRELMTCLVFPSSRGWTITGQSSGQERKKNTCYEIDHKME